MNEQQPIVDDPNAVAEAIEAAHRQVPLSIGTREQTLPDGPDGRMTYENWVHPLKHVPNLALRAGSWLIAYREPDELYHAEAGPSFGKRIYPFEVKGFIASASLDLEPVLVGDADE
jgi:hypothetical protein